MAEEVRQVFHQALAHSEDELRNAVVDLTLEGIEEPVAAVYALIERFDEFRWHQRQAQRPGVSEELARVPAEASQAIAAIRADLYARLSLILDDILPVRRGSSSRRARLRRWLCRGDA
jgi:hypothetical protein